MWLLAMFYTAKIQIILEYQNIITKNNSQPVAPVGNCYCTLTHAENFGSIKRVRTMSTFSGKDTQVLQCYSATVKKRGRKMSKKNSISLYIYKYIEVFLWYVGGKIEL